LPPPFPGGNTSGGEPAANLQQKIVTAWMRSTLNTSTACWQGWNQLRTIRRDKVHALLDAVKRTTT
jgi:hypothetical protein